MGRGPGGRRVRRPGHHRWWPGSQGEGACRARGAFGAGRRTPPRKRRRSSRIGIRLASTSCSVIRRRPTLHPTSRPRCRRAMTPRCRRQGPRRPPRRTTGPSGSMTASSCARRSGGSPSGSDRSHPVSRSRTAGPSSHRAPTARPSRRRRGEDRKRPSRPPRRAPARDRPDARLSAHRGSPRHDESARRYPWRPRRSPVRTAPCCCSHRPHRAAAVRDAGSASS